MLPPKHLQPQRAPPHPAPSICVITGQPAKYRYPFLSTYGMPKPSLPALQFLSRTYTSLTFRTILCMRLLLSSLTKYPLAQCTAIATYCQSCQIRIMVCYAKAHVMRGCFIIAGIQRQGCPMRLWRPSRSCVLRPATANSCTHTAQSAAGQVQVRKVHLSSVPVWDWHAHCRLM